MGLLNGVVASCSLDSAFGWSLLIFSSVQWLRIILVLLIRPLLSWTDEQLLLLLLMLFLLLLLFLSLPVVPDEVRYRSKERCGCCGGGVVNVPSHEVGTAISIHQRIRAAAGERRGQGRHHSCRCARCRQMLTVRALLLKQLLLLLVQRVLQSVALIIEPVDHPAQLVT